jgi:DNA-binding transcriptional LysR family regulator
MESDSFSLLKWFARSEHGVTILNEGLIRNDLKSKSLVAVPINSTILEGTKISLITRVGRKLPMATQKLLVELERFLKQAFL